MVSKEYINFFKEEGWVEQVYAWHVWCLGFILSITLIKEEKQSGWDHLLALEVVYSSYTTWTPAEQS